jgi:LPXTG-motif cell wall-anchored protein
MLRSGVRVFDIRDPLAPREVAYFSPPAEQACTAEGTGVSSCLHTGSTIAFVPERSEMWISGQQSGFHVVRLTNGVWGSAVTSPQAGAPTSAPALPPPAAPGAGSAPPSAPVVAAAPSRSLPATGAAGGVLLGAVGLLLAAGLLARRTRARSSG